MTTHEARATLQALGLTLRHRDGEFRVAFSAGFRDETEASAYYTDDLDDAVRTGLRMAQGE